MVHDKSINLAEEGAQLPRPKRRKFGFTGSPHFGEIRSQGGRHSTKDSN